MRIQKKYLGRLIALCAFVSILSASSLAVGAGGRLAVSWNDCQEPDFSFYNVYRATTQGGPYAKINAAAITEPTYTDENLEFGTTYYYVVTAVDTSDNESHYSQEVQATPVDGVAPSAPGSLSAAVLSSSRIDLSWAASSDNVAVAGYRVYRSGALLATVSGGATTYQDASAQTGVSSAYSVLAYDAAGNASPQSDAVSATASDLVAYWRFDETSGVTAADASPQGASATLQNGATWAGGQVGGAVQFDGADDRVNAGNGPHLEPLGQNLSVSFLMRNDGAGTQCALDKSVSGKGFSVRIAAGGEVAFTLGDGALAYTVRSASGAAPAGLWRHVVATVEGRQTVRLYIDSVPAQSAEGSLIGVGDARNGANLMLGSTSGGQESFTGRLDDVRLYNRALSSAEVAAFYAPGAPAGLSAEGGDAEVILDWADNTEGDLAGYDVFRATTSGGPFEKINTATAVQSAYQDTGLTNGTTYYYVVRAVDSASKASGNSGEASARPEAALAPLPEEGNRSVALSWSASTANDFHHYDVYRSTVSGGPYAKINPADLTVPEFVDTGLVNGTTYYYVVKSVDTNGNESSFSNEASATPTDDGPPAAPSALSAAAGDGRVDLDWSDNKEQDFDRYDLYRATTSGGPYENMGIAALSASAFADTTVTNGRTYYYAIKAVDAGGNASPYSSEASARPADSTAPTMPGSVKWAASAPDAISLTWSASTDAAGVSGYRVWRDGTLAATVTATLCEQTGLSEATTYAYRVSAFDAEGNESDQSAALSAKTTDLVAHWKMDETSGATASDASGLGHAATLVNGPKWAAGRESGALRFDGANDRATVEATPHIAALGQSFSLSLWVRSEALGNQVLLDEMDGGKGFRLALKTDGTIEMRLSDGANAYAIATARGAMSVGQWRHVVASIDGRTAAAFYLDGVAQTATQGTLASVGEARHPGGLTLGDANASGAPFNGLLDDVRLYNRALTLAELPSMYAPTAPTALSATAGERRVTLEWAANVEGDLAGYNIYRSSASGGPYAQANATTLSQPTFPDTGLENGTTYYYVVRAFDTAGKASGDSLEASATPEDQTPPLAPTGAWANVSDRRVSLDWNDSTEADLAHYDVYVALAPGGPYTKANAAPLSASFFATTEVENGTTYYFRVQAVDTNDNASPNSNEVAATPAAAVPPQAEAGAGRVALNWNDSPAADFAYFNVYRATATEGPFVQINAEPLVASQYEDAGLENGVTYYYMIKTFDTSDNESSASNIISATPADTAAPSVPPTPTLSIASFSSIDVAWSASTDNVAVTGYRVYRNGAEVGTVSGARYEDAGLAIGTTYTYRVAAYDAAGNKSEQSPAAAGAISALAGHWKFDEGSGSAAADASAYRHAAALENGPTWIAEGRVGGALGFDGTDDRAICVAGAPLSQLGETFTLSLWLRNQGSAAQYVLDKGALTTGFGLRILEDGRLQFVLKDGANRFLAQSDAGTTATDSWRHVAVTIDGRRSATLYVDGAAQSVTAGAALADVADVRNGVSLLVGEAQGSAERFTGQVDDLRIYARALSAAELASLYAPNAPARPSAVSGDGAATLAWSKGLEGDLAHYDVYRAEVSGGPYTRVNATPLTEPAFDDRGLTNAKTYYYAVRAVDSAGKESVLSPEVAVTPIDRTAPEAPSGMQALAQDGQVVLSWNACEASDFHHYTVYGATQPGGPYVWAGDAQLTEPRFVDTGLKNGKTYYYVVRAVDAAFNESVDSAEISATPRDAIAPQPPTGVRVGSVP